jgi:spermidine synthase
VDLDTCYEAIGAARGKVVTFGLGLGYYAFMVSEKAEVESITVIEKSPDVIRLFERYILPYFRHPKKVKIINADAFEYAEKIMPKEGFDLAFVDTWRDAGDGAPMYRQMKKLEHLSPNTKFMYWIEGFLKSRVRAERFEEIKDAMERGKDFSYGEIYDMLDKKLLSEDL